jgi:pimeloyl-ACP methyl ester carboxylesterase
MVNLSILLFFCIWFVSGCGNQNGGDQIELTENHPFRSAEARDQYMKLYEKREKSWPVTDDKRFVETSQGRTFVRMCGPTDAPPLVLLPGANATSLMWAHNILALSVHYRVYAVDSIFDYGLSVYTTTFTTPDDYVKWLDELFTALDLSDNINLMGLSYGGWLTGQYALNHPERLQKVVLIAPAGTVLPFNTGFLWRAILGLIPHSYFAKNIIYWVTEDLSRKDEASRTYIEEWAHEVATARKCFKTVRMANPTILEDEELQSIQMPALFLIGENEKIYSARDAVERLNSVAPGIKTVIVPDAGHDLTIVQADVVNRLILQFLDEM